MADDSPDVATPSDAQGRAEVQGAGCTGSETVPRCGAVRPVD